jgi:hypothetical protein
MKVRWQKLLVTVTFWLATEICFNFLGIDNLADYSEFICNQKVSYSATDSFPS